ncbi:unnamed protein product, partial [marine sediment metagenome]
MNMQSILNIYSDGIINKARPAHKERKKKVLKFEVPVEKLSKGDLVRKYLTDTKLSNKQIAE